MSADDCPCGSGRDFAACCGPALASQAGPATAEALMRSRYAAFVRGDMAYLQASQDAAQRSGFDPRETARWNKDVLWKGLEIISAEGGGPGDQTGTVEFKAYFEKGGRAGVIHELSRFVKRQGNWLYVNGEPGREPKPARLTGSAGSTGSTGPGPAKTGRNQPCPCGSGQKFKRCCGK